MQRAPDDALLADRDPRIEGGVVADLGARAHVAVGSHHHPGAELRARLDHRPRADGDALAELGVARHHRRRMDARLGAIAIRAEDPHGQLERQVRVVDQDERNAGLPRVPRADDGGRLGLFEVSVVARVGDEREIARQRLADTRDVADLDRFVAEQMPIQRGGQLLQGARHHARTLLNGRPVRRGY
jgi:hypothetical protein